LSLAELTPERLPGLSEAELGRLPLMLGNRRGTLGDCFALRVAGAGGDRLVIEASDDRLDDIGAGMRGGEIVVEGDAGASAGMGMTGGKLLIQGSAGHGAGMAMAGGELRISGDAGDQLGGALPGERNGMSEGILIVGGNAGDSAGDRMRRGTIIVTGGVRAFCGARMIAGTIAIGAGMGECPGVAMRRGSILALGAHGAVLPGFVDCGRHELAFARLLARVFAKYGVEQMAERLRLLRRWRGDLAVGGKGEILAPV
jgi:formylmethanofuran dehydrogenase subunit C